MRSCGFDTMDQCVAMISGRGGSCDRNPFLAEASASYAYAPKRHGQRTASWRINCQRERFWRDFCARTADRNH